MSDRHRIIEECVEKGVPRETAEAATAWIGEGQTELCRYYGPAYIIAYTLKALEKHEAARGR